MPRTPLANSSPSRTKKIEDRFYVLSGHEPKTPIHPRRRDPHRGHLPHRPGPPSPASRRETESGGSRRGLPDRELPASPPVRRRIASRPRQSGHRLTDCAVPLLRGPVSRRRDFPKLRVPNRPISVPSALQSLEAVPQPPETRPQPHNLPALAEKLRTFRGSSIESLGTSLAFPAGCFPPALPFVGG